jgi:hypothetical protein
MPPRAALLPVRDSHACCKSVCLPSGNAAGHRSDRPRGHPIRVGDVQARSGAGLQQRPCGVRGRRRTGGRVRPGIAFRSRLACRRLRTRRCRRRIRGRRRRRGPWKRRWAWQRRRMTYRVTCRRGRLLRQACCRYERQRYCGSERNQSHRNPPSESPRSYALYVVNLLASSEQTVDFGFREQQDPGTRPRERRGIHGSLGPSEAGPPVASPKQPTNDAQRSFTLTRAETVNDPDGGARKELQTSSSKSSADRPNIDIASSK